MYGGSGMLGGYGVAAARDGYGLVRTTAAATDVLSLAEAKAQVRVEHSADDDYLMALVRAATQRIEEDFGICMVDIGWRLSLDRFPLRHNRLAGDPPGHLEIELPRSPLSSVSSVTYLDVAGVRQTLSPSAYEVPEGRRTPVVRLAGWHWWPPTYWASDAVQVSFAAGFGGAGSVPEPLKQAVRMLLGHWYRNRESVAVGAPPREMPQAVEYLVAPWWPGRYA